MTDLIPVTPSRPLPIETCLQSIASAAHLRGAVTTRSGAVLGELPAADLMRALRGAWTKATPARRDRVENIIRTIALHLRRDGPVQIGASVLGVVRSYAGLTDQRQGGRRKRRAA